MAKASLAVAIIAKNAGKTIGDCIDSLTPYVREVVVCVDQTTTDGTAAIAKRHKAKVFTGLHVSEPHECIEHGQISVPHFANARQASFSKLRTDVHWWMWVDADDVVKGAEKLADFLGKLAPEVAGVWLPYHYSTVGPNNATSTLFDRERIVRSSLPWRWQHRVHEILAPVGTITEHLTWARTDDIAVYHQDKGHDTAASARRNITCLEVELEVAPNDMRSLFYMGNQYFALAEWPAAIHYYNLSLKANNPYQVWQSYLYLSMAYEKMGNGPKATQAAHAAMDTAPYHPDPYYRLAQLAMLMGDVQRCAFWTQLGDRLPDAPFFAFKNPLDRPFNARVTLGNAYFNAGEVSKARREFEKANATVPTEQLQKGIAEFSQMERDSQLADAYVRVLGAMNGQTPKAPDSIWKFGRVRDAVVPAMLKARPHSQPRIVFWCGKSVEHWAPPSINTTGVGGSETAVIKIAERFSRDGWRVDVYNEPDKFEGEYDGVGYWGLNRFGQGERADALVSWRNASIHSLPIERRLSLLWCHDLNKGGGAEEDSRRWDRVLGVSRWHADYLSQVYGLQNTDFVPNGIDLTRFAVPVNKVPFRCVYASSPDRGLDRLLQLWPQIVANEPSAELHIAYGWETMDKYIQMGAQQLVPFKEHMVELIAKTPGVVWRGRLPQDELAKLYGESYALLYPADFTEVSCIVAMEAMAAGCVPIVSAVGALRETVSDGGLVVAGNVYTRSWRDYYVNVAKGVLHAPDVRKQYEQAGKERAKMLTWDQAYERWKEIITKQLEGEKALEAVGV